MVLETLWNRRYYDTGDTTIHEILRYRRYYGTEDTIGQEIL